jgi:hypothetical protein
MPGSSPVSPELGRLSESKQRADSVDRINTGSVAVLVKVGVAGNFDRITQAEPAVAVAVPAFEIVIAIADTAVQVKAVFASPRRSPARAVIALKVEPAGRRRSRGSRADRWDP